VVVCCRPFALSMTDSTSFKPHHARLVYQRGKGGEVGKLESKRQPFSGPSPSDSAVLPSFFRRARTVRPSILLLVALGGLLILAAWLRWRFIVTVQPYPDEFVTLLAVKMILQKGVPILPSGLFYEHGLLFSYAGAVASALLGFSRETVRATSLLFGLLTVGLAWHVGRRWYSPGAGLVAATLHAVAPAAVLWGGRARMYTLLQWWVLLTLYFVFVGVLFKRPGWRYLALAFYLGATLTQFVAITLIPPLALATVAVGWLAARLGGERPWFRSRWIWLESGGLVAVALVAFLVKRAGQPKGIAPLEATGTGLAWGVAQVAGIYADVSTDLVGSWQALSSFFIAPEALLPTALALLAVGWAGLNWLRRRPAARDLPTLFLALILIITTLEMVLFVSPERRDEKYLFMLQPALFLLAADGLTRLGKQIARAWPALQSYLLSPIFTLFAGLVLIAYNWPATSALLARTGSDYDTAFGYVRDHWQEGDKILTGTPPAAELYLSRNDYYAARGTGGYAYRILQHNGQDVDRWIGSPWLETDEEIYAALSDSRRVWLVLERWGLIKEYYSPLTMQRIMAMTDFVREDDGIIVLRSRPTTLLIPENPTVHLQVNFDDQLSLEGYDVAWQRASNPEIENRNLGLVLYWRTLRQLPYDYTVFVHLRDADEGSVAQADHQPLAPVYPPTLWPVGEMVRDYSVLSIPSQIPPGSYSLWVGLYRLDTLERLPIIEDTSGENAVSLGQVVVP
jgi:4-amino-4-deoxy-L-arabinose transferase-like glycosyltransferase